MGDLDDGDGIGLTVKLANVAVTLGLCFVGTLEESLCLTAADDLD